jgi:phosphatidylserine/phosphatidylglycerophosphate/cardiolipin synthase-like enzyme
MATLAAEPRPKAVSAFEAASAGSLELVGRACKLRAYRKLKTIPDFRISGRFIAFASPDSTYAVTKPLIDGARKSILIGIYDFTAEYMQELLEKAMRRGVKVALMLDLDNRSGETPLFEALVRHGCEGVPAPSCASENARYFASSHEKVIVIDDEWTLVQSGNYSDSSIPQNEHDGRSDPADWIPGNRDMGIAVQSKPLAAFFTKLLRADMELELNAPEAVRARRQRGVAELLEAAPANMPGQLFPSRSLKPSGAIKVLPILSPDNYMDAIPAWLRTARASIEIEEQYIRTAQEQIGELLTAIASTVDEYGVQVRIVLAQPFSCMTEKCEKAFGKAKKEIQALGKKYGLKLGDNVRVLDPGQFVHCHNKLIIVDRSSVLISSQNWSDSAVTKNREAGLLIYSPELARYYGRIFDHDWETGLHKVTPKKRKKFGPEALGTGKVVPLNWGDYAEV